MARLVWALFCEEQRAEAAGKSSYIRVFDSATVGIKAPPGEPPAREPLSAPVPTIAFVLALHLQSAPGAPECTVRVKDSDDRDILPPLTSQLADNPLGRHNLHLRFQQGIPVVRSGVYSFEVYIDGELVGEAELPVSLDLE
jgi:hypothetical protein